MNKEFVQYLAQRLNVQDITSIEESLGIAVDVIAHDGGLLDFDCMLNVSSIVDFSISYELYKFIDNWYRDQDLMDLGDENREELERCVRYWLSQHS